MRDQVSMSDKRQLWMMSTNINSSQQHFPSPIASLKVLGGFYRIVSNLGMVYQVTYPMSRAQQPLRACLLAICSWDPDVGAPRPRAKDSIIEKVQRSHGCQRSENIPEVRNWCINACCKHLHQLHLTAARSQPTSPLLERLVCMHV